MRGLEKRGIMFRPGRRKNKEIGREAAEMLLINERRGVLAVNGDEGYPYAIPVNYYYDQDSKKIYFHGARVGHKVDSLKKSDKICFTVFGNETIKEEAWAPYMQSVVIFGRCHLIDDQVDSDLRLRRLAEKYYPNNETIEEEIQKFGKAVQMYEIEIEHLSGKEIQER